MTPSVSGAVESSYRGGRPLRRAGMTISARSRSARCNRSCALSPMVRYGSTRDHAPYRICARHFCESCEETSPFARSLPRSHSLAWRRTVGTRRMTFIAHGRTPAPCAAGALVIHFSKVQMRPPVPPVHPWPRARSRRRTSWSGPSTSTQHHEQATRFALPPHGHRARSLRRTQGDSAPRKAPTDRVTR